MTEEWRPIAGYEGLYEVSNIGRIRSLRLRAGRYDRERATPLIRAMRLHDGYPVIDLPGPDRKRKTEITFRVHCIVCETFNGPKPDGFECAHLNGDRADCRAENLKWASPTENQSHRILHGTDCRGSRQYSAILTEQDVIRMRREYVHRRGQIKEWANNFGCTTGAVWRAINGKTWRHI